MSRILYTQPGRVLGTVASVEDTHTVRVSWEPNPNGEITGYNVYRARGTDIYGAFPGNYTKVNPSAITGTEFVDTLLGTALGDRTARGYVVTAVNGRGEESGPSGECTTLPDSPEWAWTVSQSSQMAFRWQPPRRNKILGVNLYRIHEDSIFDATKLRVLCGGGDFYFPVRTYATLWNGTIAAPALITDTLTFWPLPPNINIPVGTDKTGYYLQGQTFIARAVNVLGQEGFGTDEISPVNTEYGYGLVPLAQRFNYANWNPVVTETGAALIMPVPAIQTWPNPFCRVLTIAFRAVSAAPARVRLIDAAGRIVISENLRARAGLNERSLTLPKMGSGIYVAEVSCGKSVFRKPVVITK
jgi:hypothetical protein